MLSAPCQIFKLNNKICVMILCVAAITVKCVGRFAVFKYLSIFIKIITSDLLKRHETITDYIYIN